MRYNEVSGAVRNCIITENFARMNGGGIAIFVGPAVPRTPEVTDTLIAGNVCGIGGGMFIAGDNWGFTPLWRPVNVVRSRFVDNHAPGPPDGFGIGGGLCILRSDASAVVGCEFRSNTAGADGGAIYVSQGYGALAGDRFGGATASIVNSTIAGNSASRAAGIYVSDWPYDSAGGVRIINSIVYGNTDDGGSGEASQLATALDGGFALENSCVQGLTGGIPGSNNIGEDPWFVAPGVDLHIKPASPAVDAGQDLPYGTLQLSPTDLDGNPRFFDGNGDGVATVDMGAYESQVTQVCVLADPPLTPDPDPFGSHKDKNRYLSMVIPTSAVASDVVTAIRVRLTSLHHPAAPEVVPDFTDWEGKFRWVNSVHETHTCPDNVTHGTTIRCAVLGCDPEYRAWGKELGGDVLHVGGAAVVPSSTYGAAQLAETCEGIEATVDAVSDQLSISTSPFGDVDPFTDGLVVLDIARVVDHVKGKPYPTTWPPEPGTALFKPFVHLRPNVPDALGENVGVLDIATAVDAVKGNAYWHSGDFGPCTDACAGEAPCP